MSNKAMRVSSSRPSTSISRPSPSLAENFSYLPSIPIPSAMTVDVVKRTKIHYSVEKEGVTWTLVAARALDALAPRADTGTA